MALRFDPKTGRVIVGDLTPSHKNKTTDVHGVGTGTIVGSNEFDDYKREQEEEQLLRDLEAQYNTLMLNERHSSNRMGYEVR